MARWRSVVWVVKHEAEGMQKRHMGKAHEKKRKAEGNLIVEGVRPPSVLKYMWERLMKKMSTRLGH